MNRKKRKEVLKILNSGHSAVNIYEQIASLFNQPTPDIERIIINSNWNKKQILLWLNYFPQV